jgi:hypothetical protein
MVIIKLSGGMGNQMFQYALYKAFKNKGIEAKIDDSKYKQIVEIRDCFLKSGCFNLDYDLCTKKEARKYVIGTGMVARIIVNRFGDKNTHYYEKSELVYDPEIFEILNGYLEGYWQSWKYFGDIQDEIKNEFRFINVLDGKYKDYFEKIQQSESVAVHIRRGDYLNNPEIYGGICTEQYYIKAMEQINGMVANPTYYFFSNDIEWSKSTFGEQENYIYVEGNDEKRGYIDMQLMSECRHQITANSSFSWWAAYLNKNPNKIVICPDKWVNGKETPDIYCEDWIKINGTENS